ncbi:uncharacterized protein LOC113458658 [Zonotrichia albicollis]|uniref:uncharacterized protein LOC113458658 n=1 Tax=Zonotrichia albicollis TaxID=44394 RepID=UPI000EAAECDD|nr:uncharacterized protein LOC113458658 [Zonotrichia albicollis]
MRSSLLKISALNLSLELASQSFWEVSGSRGRGDVGVSASVCAAAASGCRSACAWRLNPCRPLFLGLSRRELTAAAFRSVLRVSCVRRAASAAPASAPRGCGAFQLLQMICKFSIMAIHSFCHLEEPVPQNNDLKKAHSFARKSLHLGISTDAAQGCFFKSSLWYKDKTGFLSKNRVLYLKIKKVLDIQWDENLRTDYWGLPGYRSGPSPVTGFVQMDLKSLGA